MECSHTTTLKIYGPLVKLINLEAGKITPNYTLFTILMELEIVLKATIIINIVMKFSPLRMNKKL